MVKIIGCREGDGRVTGSGVHGAYETGLKILRSSRDRCSRADPEGSDNTIDAHRPGDPECPGRRRGRLEAGAGGLHRQQDVIQEVYEGLGGK